MKDDTSKILAIDPGEKTGIAFVVNGEMVWGMVADESAFNSENFIRSLTSMTRPTTIVLEAPPSQTPHHNKAQVKIFELLKGMYEIAGLKVVTMNPGQWKGLVERSKVDSTHIKDACDIAKMQYRRERKAAEKV